ncbi:MAG: TlpA family protein disulfide reductase [Oscillibacter sp.]|jgi:thiol-disulfide isomerase/thioredoxin|nr:TlpA family protein disulfide reductase [Oscillibacter sp.]
MSKRLTVLLGHLMLTAALLCGCGGDSGGPAVGAAPEAEPPAVTAPEGESQEALPSEEEAAPIYITFEGTDLEGNAVSQEIFTRSGLTMVNVWATFCNPCLSEMPGLGELAAEYDPSEFQIIGVVSDVREGEDQTLVEDLVRETGADYTHLLANASLDQALLSSVSGVPTTFFFDGEGAYLGGVVGAAEKSYWEELIHGLLEE